MVKKTKKIVVQKKKKNTKQMTRLGGALRALGGLGGGAIGSLIGMPNAGSSLGSGLGASLSKWLGSGDYSVTTNSIVNRTLKGSSSIPSMHEDGQSVVIRHKEFVTEVRGSQNFLVRASFDINPGRNETFPWLAAVAHRFQEYRIRGMVWHYVPSSGSAVSGTNAALGTVMLQTSYRSNDTAPTSKHEVLNEYWSSESVPNEAFCHPIECDPKENPFNVQYVRTDAVPSGDSKLLYDLGVTHLCVSGQQADNMVLGDLWCTYEIELKKPIIESNVTTGARCCDLMFTGAPVSASWFNGTMTRRGTLEVTANANTITFPPHLTGVYLVSVIIRATTTFTACDLSGAPSVSGGTLMTLPSGASYYRTVLSGGGQVNQGNYEFIVWIPDKAQQCSVAFTGTFTGASTQSLISVAPFNVFT